MEAGQSLGPYTVLEPLGAGGMGEVYLCVDERLGRRVALKVVAAGHETDDTARRRLIREARTASALNHPQICTIYDVGEEGDRVFIALEYIDGAPLGELIGKNGLAPEIAAEYAVQIADALAHAHRESILHCDLKSANVMVTRTGWVKVLDFGLASPVAGSDLEKAQASMTTLADAGAIAGTLPYMAPELLRGARPDERSDIWALGVVLHEMLCGALPFAGATPFELSSAILGNDVAPLPDGAGALGDLASTCLQRDPKRRFASADELLEALIKARKELLDQSAPPTGADIADEDDTVRSIAVLPLDNLTGDPSQEYFSDGMTDALLTELAKVGALKVISRTSVMRFKGARQPLPEIARELKVDAIVEGSVFRAGDEVRITAQLIHARSDAHLWAESYDRDLRNILALQKEVARDIAAAVRVALTPREKQELTTASTVDPAVYEAILRGRFHIYKFTPDDLEKGLRWLRRALELDPASAPAHAYLAMVYGALGTWGDMRPGDVWPEGHRFALRALELDPTLPEARLVVSLMQAFKELEREAAEAELRALIDENPNMVEAYYNLGLLRAGRGDAASASKLLERAVELDPLSAAMLVDSTFPMIHNHELDAAIERLHKAMELEPGEWRAHWLLASAFILTNQFARSIEAAEQAVLLSGRNVRAEAALISALATAGETDRARAALQALLASGERRFLFPTAVATACASLGETDAAIDWLEKGHEERDLFMLFIGVDPLLRRALGEDPRYLDLLERIDLLPTADM